MKLRFYEDSADGDYSIIEDREGLAAPRVGDEVALMDGDTTRYYLVKEVLWNYPEERVCIFMQEE